ncbi:MAG: thiolase family protein [Chloroflexi bacterium]|nr:thiolase family protein [Dehalococcoidia bacterium]MCZ7579013.1 thiolase family protein [Dehalococcoidia bacterium]NJD66185.1 thiolase family protein [Chloroflexota bacterium]PWB48320.1 MAG: acetyl-CoA C-acyltransferase [Dehalococcoidia bacterium]
MREVVIVDAIRTPLGRRGGVLSKNHPVETSSLLLKALVSRNNLDPEVVDDVIYGCVSEVGAQSTNLARNVVLTAGWPYTIPGVTLDRQCSSSQQAVHFAANQIGSGVHEVVVAGGTEFMSQIPLGANMGQGLGFPFTQAMQDQYDLSSQGIAAERIAEKWGISRGEADEFAVESQARAAQAQKEGRFKNELVPVPGKKKIKKADGTEEWEDATIDFDEGIRPGTTLEVLSALKPSFKEDGVHHAGNSSQITDGSSAVLLTHPDKAKEMGWKPRARIVSQAVVGSDPALMLTGPITATPLALTRAGITMRDIDLVEINEAFASVVLAWKREMNADMSKVNVNGGAIALGHPTGCTGARLFGTLLNELERTGGRYGLVTMCVGGGIGTATVIERLG